MPQAHLVREIRCIDGIVVLDLEQDTYSCCYDPIGDGDERGAPHVADERLIWSDLPALYPTRLRLVDVLHFGAALVVTALRLPRFSFWDLIDRERPPMSYPISPRYTRDAMAPVVQRFERMALWLPLRDKCLFRSAFLIEYLRRHRLSGNWVFGVSLFPFKAHCWVADGSLLLGERSHRITRFRTIFIAGPPNP